MTPPSKVIIMIMKKLRTGPFGCYTWLFVCPESGDGALVDPGDEIANILKMVRKTLLPNSKKVTIAYLFLTHAHNDHYGVAREVKTELSRLQTHSPRIVLHAADESMYFRLHEQGRMFGGEYLDPSPIDVFCKDKQTFQLGCLTFSVIHTPGHSPGSVCFIVEDKVTKEIFVATGDTLFKGTIGTSDFWEGDREQMIESIKTKLFVLPEKVVVCPGHGAMTTIAEEKKNNTFQESQVYPIPE